MRITGSAINTSTANQLNNANRNNIGNSNKSQNSEVDNLMKQREDLVKKKNALMAKTAENGQPLDSIQDQLKIYDQQIQTLTSQIAKETKEAAKEAIPNKESNSNSNIDLTSTPKTEEEIANKKLSSMTKLGAGLETVKTISSVKSKVENQANITQSEIETDNSNRADFIEHVSWTNPEAASLLSQQGASDNKYDKLAGLKQRIDELSQSLGSTMNDVQQEIEDSKTQEKIQALVKKWNESDKTDSTKTSSATTSEAASSPNALRKFDEAFKNASKATSDFLASYDKWNQEANENKLTDNKKVDFLNDKLEEWEDNLHKKSPEQYESWKILTASLDVYA